MSPAYKKIFPQPPRRAKRLGMKCPSCQADNSPLASICQACGASMIKTELPQPVTHPPQLLLTPDQREKALRRAAQPAEQRVVLKAGDPETALVEPADSQLMTDPPHVLAEEAGSNSAFVAEPADSSLLTDPPHAQSENDETPSSADPDDLSASAESEAPIESEPVAAISVHRKVTLASSWKRMLAGSVDLLIVLLVCGVFLSVAISRLPDTVGPAKGVGFDRLIDAMWVYHQATIPALLVFVLILFLFQFVFIFLLGQTPGLMLMHLYVMSTQQRSLGALTALKRALFMLFGLLSLGLGWSWIFWDGQRRAWHDLWAKTLVGHALDEVATLLPQEVEREV